ncbi:MAG: hypothetical protein WA970_19325, partial [Gammaproteobacteria bacterium]
QAAPNKAVERFKSPLYEWSSTTRPLRQIKRKNCRRLIGPVPGFNPDYSSTTFSKVIAPKKWMHVRDQAPESPFSSLDRSVMSRFHVSKLFQRLCTATSGRTRIFLRHDYHESKEGKPTGVLTSR